MINGHGLSLCLSDALSVLVVHRKSVFAGSKALLPFVCTDESSKLRRHSLPEGR